MINALDNGKSAGDFSLNWKETLRAVTSGGDAVLAGYFYAPQDKVSWGQEGNPEIYTKIWFSRDGGLNVNFFHVGVFDTRINTRYNNASPSFIEGGKAGDNSLIGIGEKNWRYVRHDYSNWRQCASTLSSSASNGFEYSFNSLLAQANTLTLSATAPGEIEISGLGNGACPLKLQGLMLGALDNGKPAGDFSLNWKETLRATTSGGDAVLAGYFYAPQDKVSWGQEGNPEIYAKIWFSRDGQLNVNFFHVGVFDTKITTSYNNGTPAVVDGGKAGNNSLISIGDKAWRYVRHDYNNWRQCN